MVNASNPDMSNADDGAEMVNVPNDDDGDDDGYDCFDYDSHSFDYGQMVDCFGLLDPVNGSDPRMAETTRSMNVVIQSIHFA